MKIELEANLESADSSLTPDDWNKLQGMRIVGVGMCEKHGNAVLILSDNGAPHSADIYANLNCLAEGMQDTLRGVAQRARAKGQL